MSTSYGACASGAMAIDVARARILAGLCDVALVVGADTTPKGFLAPNAGDRPDDPDWLRFRLLGATNPTYFALMARRRMDLYGATAEDFAAVKVKNARHGLANPRARYRKEVTVEEVLDSPVVADPLHLLDICATSDGGAAVVLVSEAKARQLGTAAVGARVRVRGRLQRHADVPEHRHRDAQLRHRLLRRRGARRRAPSWTRSPTRAYEQAGIGPDDVSLAEVYDLATALELDWYEHLGLCEPGEAEKLLRDGDTDHRRPGPGEPERRPGLLRRGRARPGHRPGLRDHLAAPGPGRRPPGRGRPGRRHRQQGPLRPRLLGAALDLSRSRGDQTVPPRGVPRRRS